MSITKITCEVISSEAIPVDYMLVSDGLGNAVWTPLPKTAIQVVKELPKPVPIVVPPKPVVTPTPVAPPPPPPPITAKGKTLLSTSHERNSNTAGTCSNVASFFNGIIPKRVYVNGNARQVVMYINGGVVMNTGNNNTQDASFWITINPANNGSFTYNCNDASYGAGYANFVIADWQL